MSYVYTASFSSTALLFLSLFMVALVFLLGMINFIQVDRPDRAHKSQVLMRWRVILQCGAILIALFCLWLQK